MKHAKSYIAALIIFIATSCSNFSSNNPDKGLTKAYNDSGELLPYPKSELISSFFIDTARLSIGHGDNWAITWADDDKQYSFFTDGKGFGTYEEDVSIAPVVLEGDPPHVTGKDILSLSGTLSYEGGDVNSAKVCGLLMIEGILYAWIRRNIPFMGDLKKTERPDGVFRRTGFHPTFHPNGSVRMAGLSTYCIPAYLWDHTGLISKNVQLLINR